MDVLWGSYAQYEGPWTRGSRPFRLSDSPSPDEEIIAVITATEGGTYDAVNMYDSCLWTVGVIQWCNRAPQHSVDDMLGGVIEVDKEALQPLLRLALERGYTFSKTPSGKYRFFRGGNPVDSPDEQQILYFLHATGLKNGWDAESRGWARQWCAASAAVWTSAAARRVQLDYTVRRARSFAVGHGHDLLKACPDNAIGRAWRAMYLSFAANNPSKAAAAAMACTRETNGLLQPWSQEWLSSMAYYLTTHPGIAIYPQRYDKIRPVIERLFDVNLPDFAGQLSKWSAANFGNRWYDVVELQRALLALGYDLGPKGADGVMGHKTTSALLSFEIQAGVPREHQNGLMDVHTAAALERALEKKGVSSLA